MIPKRNIIGNSIGNKSTDMKILFCLRFGKLTGARQNNALIRLSAYSCLAVVHSSCSHRGRSFVFNLMFFSLYRSAVDDFGEYPMDIIRRKKKRSLSFFSPEKQLEAFDSFHYVRAAAKRCVNRYEPDASTKTQKDKRNEIIIVVSPVTSDSVVEIMGTMVTASPMWFIWGHLTRLVSWKRTLSITQTDTHTRTHVYIHTRGIRLRLNIHKVFFDSPVDN